MAWDSQKAVEFLRKNAAGHSLGRCAHYVREAIEAGGVTLLRHGSAKDYGQSLTRVGFAAVASDRTYVHQAGDVAIVQPIEGHPHGHMAMFDGVHWISDFVQWHGVYPGHSYREAKPAYQIYRYPLIWAGPDEVRQEGTVA